MSFVENHQWKPISQTVNKRGDANLKDDSVNSDVAAVTN